MLFCLLQGQMGFTDLITHSHRRACGRSASWSNARFGILPKDTRAGRMRSEPAIWSPPPPNGRQKVILSVPVDAITAPGGILNGSLLSCYDQLSSWPSPETLPGGRLAEIWSRNPWFTQFFLHFVPKQYNLASQPNAVDSWKSAFSANFQWVIVINIAQTLHVAD